jgi:uncharacterized OsmC-like protein
MKEYISLREYFEKILEEKDKALNAALIAVKAENQKTEVAAEKRFDLLNELRGDVATKAQLQALEKVVESLTRLVYTGVGVIVTVEILLRFFVK